MCVCVCWWWGDDRARERARERARATHTHIHTSTHTHSLSLSLFLSRTHRGRGQILPSSLSCHFLALTMIDHAWSYCTPHLLHTPVSSRMQPRVQACGVCLHHAHCSIAVCALSVFLCTHRLEGLVQHLCATRWRTLTTVGPTHPRATPPSTTARQTACRLCPRPRNLARRR